MNNTSVTPPRARAEIIADLTARPGAVQGKICEDRRVLADGTTAVYHNLQYWSGGRNHTIRIQDQNHTIRNQVQNRTIPRTGLASRPTPCLARMR